MKYLTQLLTIVLLCGGVGKAQNAKTIIHKADDKFRGTTSKQEMTINIIRPNWSRSMSVKTWMKGEDYAMILITAPEKEAGSAFLKRSEEVWNWKPRIERTIKLPPSMMMQSWMGTDFTNNFLVKQASLVEDYKHYLQGDTTLEGRKCHKIKLVPKPDAAVVWSKVVMYISKDEYLQLRSDYFDEQGQCVKRLVGSEVKTLGGRQLPAKLAMIPLNKKGHKTVIRYEKMKFDIEIPDRFFSKRKMKELR